MLEISTFIHTKSGKYLRKSAKKHANFTKKEKCSEKIFLPILFNVIISIVILFQFKKAEWPIF